MCTTVVCSAAEVCLIAVNIGWQASRVSRGQQHLRSRSNLIELGIAQEAACRILINVAIAPQYLQTRSFFLISHAINYDFPDSCEGIVASSVKAIVVRILDKIGN